MLKTKIKPFYSFRKLNGERGFARNWNDVILEIGNKTHRCERLDTHLPQELILFLSTVEGWTEEDKNILNLFIEELKEYNKI